MVSLSLTTGAEIAGIVGAIGTVIGLVVNRSKPVKQNEEIIWGADKSQTGPHDLEIIPVFFEVDAKALPPTVWISCQFVNHTKRSIKSVSGEVYQLYLNGMNPAIEGIPLSETHPIEIKGSRHAVFKRNLNSFEVEALRRTFASDGRVNGTMRLRAQGRSGSKEVEFQPHATLRFNGWAVGFSRVAPGATSS